MQQRVEEYRELIHNQMNLFASVYTVTFTLLAVVIVWLFWWHQKRADDAEKRHRVERAEIEQKLLQAQEIERKQLESLMGEKCVLEENLREEELRNIKITFEMQKQKIEHEKKLAELNNRHKLAYLETLLSQTVQRLESIGRGGNTKKAMLGNGALNKEVVELCEEEKPEEAGDDYVEAKHLLSLSIVPRVNAMSPD
uniref:Uncharacterized protein n=1 Tax=Plectus sambesii TaxID=2011161 RepID=A0A914VR02_9BILA